MKIRIRYSKTGAMRYVGHLDTLHYFQKAFRRTGLRLGFSKGFSPHLLLTFASPLSIGMTTEGDYLDVVIEEERTAEEVLAALREQMSEGFRVTEAVRLREEAKTPMALLRAASYRITPASLPADTAGAILERVPSFAAQESIPVIKKTKKGERQEDIRPLIYLMEAGRSGIDLMCASGSIEHLKPELVMHALMMYAGESSSFSGGRNIELPGEQDEFLMWHYHRTELYGVDPRELKPGDPLGDHVPRPLLELDT